MNVKYVNGTLKWLVILLSISAVIFNSGVLYTQVKHLTAECNMMRQDFKEVDGKVSNLIMRQQQLFDKLIDEHEYRRNTESAESEE